MVKARDQRIPEKTGQGIVTILVTRDGSVPYFVGEPYNVSIPETQPVDSRVIRVVSRDDTLSVSWLAGHTR